MKDDTKAFGRNAKANLILELRKQIQRHGDTEAHTETEDYHTIIGVDLLQNTDEDIKLGAVCKGGTSDASRRGPWEGSQLCVL